MSTSLLIVDDHPWLADALAQLASAAGWGPVNVATSQSEGRALAQRLRPDLVSVDLTLGEESGVVLIEQLKEDQPHLTVVVLTGDVGGPRALECIASGASAFIPKSAQPDEILSAFDAAAAGLHVAAGAADRRGARRGAAPAAAHGVGRAGRLPVRPRARRARADGGRARPQADRPGADDLVQHRADPREERAGQARAPTPPWRPSASPCGPVCARVRSATRSSGVRAGRLQAAVQQAGSVRPAAGGPR